MTEFKTIVHFRELGGLKTTNGKRIKKGFFYRCGELSHLSDEDKKKLDALNINKVFDLRRPSEARQNPDYQGNFTYILNSTRSDESNRDRLYANKGAFIDRFIDMDEARYNYTIFNFSQGYLEIPHFKTCVLPILQSLDEHKPILFHCFAGKDRTGIIAMIISAALGCDYQTCKENYLYHNQLMDEELIIYHKQLKEMNATSWGVKGYIDANSAREQWFDCAWCSIFNSYRTIDDYLKEEMGITQAQIDDWRTFYLE